MDVGPVSTAAAYNVFGKNKGCGYDKLPAEVLQAGEDALACNYSCTNERVLSMLRGRPDGEEDACKKSHKNRGGPMISDSSIGMFLADRSGSALAGMAKEKIDPEYEEGMAATQFGAVPTRGADQASHIV